MAKSNAGMFVGSAVLIGAVGFIAHRLGYSKGYTDASAQYKELERLAQNTVQTPGATTAGVHGFWSRW
jgi:hypothetical protein